MNTPPVSRGRTSAVVLVLSVAFYAACDGESPSPSPSPSTDAASDGLTACARLEGTAARLDCYDKLAGRNGTPSPATTDAAVAPPEPTQCPEPTADASVDADANVDADASTDAGSALTCPITGRSLWYAKGCCCTAGTPGPLCGCTCTDVDQCASGVFKYSPKNGDMDYCFLPEGTPPVKPPPNYELCATDGGGFFFYDSTKFECTITSNLTPK